MTTLDDKTHLEMTELLKQFHDKINEERDLHPSQYLDEDVKLIYTLGHKLYSLGNYKESEVMFMRLVLARGDNLNYWKGLASSRQMQDDFAGSLVAWGMCAMLDEEDLDHHIFGAECLIKLEEMEKAHDALKFVEEKISEDHKSYGRFKKLQIELAE